MKKLKFIYEALLDEDYPIEFNMDEFKKLNSFNKRVKYCNQKLYKISSGSSRIVYRVDDTKVLKLAKNNKGIGQCEVEIEYSQYHDLSDIVAKTFDYHPNSLWVEMELAEKLTEKLFYEITGYKFKEFGNILLYDAYRIHNNGVNPFKSVVNTKVMGEMWNDNELGYDIQNFIANYDIKNAGDLARLSTYGIVNRNGNKEVVMIDYGLTNDVYDKYYS